MNEFVVIFLEVEHSRMLPSAQAPPASPASDSALSLEAFTRLLRQPTSLDAYLGKTTTSVTIETTSTNVHCYHLKHDGNRHPRVGDLCTRLIHAIVDYAIPRSEFSTALKETLATNSHYHMSRLREKAANLFTNLANTGEGGELLLYLLAECFLGIPQLLCKMPLKTNSRMHFHGTDGIHGTVNPK
jgi:Cap4 SAVED domain